MTRKPDPAGFDVGTIAPSELTPIERARTAYDDGFSDGVILALQILNQGGDMGSAYYQELLETADPYMIYMRAKSEGMLEMSGLSDYLKLRLHQPAAEIRQAIRQRLRKQAA